MFKKKKKKKKKTEVVRGHVITTILEGGCSGSTTKRITRVMHLERDEAEGVLFFYTQYCAAGVK